MSDTKGTALPENATPTLDDLLITVDDPSGTPVTSKSTIEQIFAAGSYTTTFDNSDLSSGVLTITHSLGEQYPHVTLVNSSGAKVTVGISYTDTNNFNVDLSSIAPISGTWKVRASL